jgi:hypothetical protein
LALFADRNEALMTEMELGQAAKIVLFTPVSFSSLSICFKMYSSNEVLAAAALFLSSVFIFLCVYF